MIPICDFCGRTFPIDQLIRVRFKGERFDNTYCHKCFPEVKKSYQSVTWYDGYVIKPWKIENEE